MAEVSDLTAHTGYLLRMVSNAVSQDFARAVAGQGVTVAEWVVLRSLFGAEARAPHDLAARMGMTRGAISKLADRLVAKALVARRAHETDGRGQVLSLTPLGQALVPVLASLADQNDASYFGALPPAEHQMLIHILQRLIEGRGLTSTPVD